MKPKDLMLLPDLPGRRPGLYARFSASGSLTLSSDAMTLWPAGHSYARFEHSGACRELWLTPVQAAAMSCRRLTRTSSDSKLLNRISVHQWMTTLKITAGQYAVRWESGCLVIALGAAPASPPVNKVTPSIGSLPVADQTHIPAPPVQPPRPDPASKQVPCCGECLFHVEVFNPVMQENVKKCQSKASGREDNETADSDGAGCIGFTRKRPGAPTVPAADNLPSRCMERIEHRECPACGRRIMIVNGRGGVRQWRQHVKSRGVQCPNSGKAVSNVNGAN